MATKSFFGEQSLQAAKQSKFTGKQTDQQITLTDFQYKGELFKRSKIRQSK